jgi:hypothetical protein
MTDKHVWELIHDNIEAATTAVNALMNEGSYDPDYDDKETCKRLVAQVLESRTVPVPKDYPSSHACIAYGFAIAAHIVLTKGH